ncbi:MAG: glucan biosynthesis protein, partial [Rhodovibrionaceae bacterium]
MQRRKFLGASLSGLTALGLGGSGLGVLGRPSLAEEDAAAPRVPEAGEETPFDRAQLVEQARQLATEPFSERDKFAPERLPEMGYSEYNSIRYRHEEAVWAERESPFRIELFHPGLYFPRPVEIFVVEDGQARNLAFDKALFDYADPEIEKQVAEDLGFVGFRAFHRSDWQRDFLSFLGASYFRAVGATMQYGLSARGIAVETSNLGNEEFPRFTAFWLERPEPAGAGLTVHALLDGQSLTGLYTFRAQPTINTEIDVTASLFPRRELANVGIAPITSMYYAGENDWLERRLFRAEAHDSDGLAMHRGNGEWVWRPLANPNAPRVSTFMDETPRGFGLLQRDRDFDNYNDLGADYEDRPNLWIEPQGDWGPGHVELVELPTDDETFDNVVAYWRPQQPL